MSAPNPAATAQPGWRGTDPDGGTWVRLDREDLWFEILAAGRGSYRSQEEAEAAGLVPLVAETQPVLSSAIFAPKPRLTITDLKFEPAAPASLDPDNPEHLRQVADLFPYVRGYAESPHHAVALSARDWLESEADRLDRERAEAERDAKAREVATEIARGCWPFDSFDNAVAALTQAVRVDLSKDGEK